MKNVCRKFQNSKVMSTADIQFVTQATKKTDISRVQGAGTHEFLQLLLRREN